MAKKQNLHFQSSFTLSKSVIRKKADENYGNGLIGYGEAIEVPHGIWVLRISRTHFGPEVVETEVKVRFVGGNGEFVYDHDLYPDL